MSSNEFQRVLQQKKEDMRWRLLSIAGYAGKTGVTDSIAMSPMRELFAGITRDELREALDYLEKKELIELDRAAVDWRYTLTAFGIDCFESNAEVPVGIRKPG